MNVEITHYLVLSAILFVIGGYGVLTRKNIIVVLLCLELMLNSVNLTFITFSRLHGDMIGHVFMIMAMTVSAAEVAVGLAIVVAIYAHKESVNIDLLKVLKG